ncbi:MAG: hypothetical protein AAGA83_25610 [Cyanobacteria bacterium P01_F01_bin.116]
MTALNFAVRCHQEFAEMAGIPEDVWEQMPDSQKLLILAKRVSKRRERR